MQPERMIRRARRLRKAPTRAEEFFWSLVRERQLNGLRFRRQVPIGLYVVDFACLSARLIIEADGSQHADNRNDERRTAHLNIPVFMGVWPLLSGRQAECRHNEVPGIVVPDAVRAKMAGAEGPEGRAKGVQLAKDVADAALQHYDGIYLITPFLQYETTVELAEFARSR